MLVIIVDQKPVAGRRTVQMGQSQVCKDKVETQSQPFPSHNAKAIGFYHILSTSFTIIAPLTLSLHIFGDRAKTKSVKNPHPIPSPTGKALVAPPIPQIIFTNWREMLHQSGPARPTQAVYEQAIQEYLSQTYEPGEEDIEKVRIRLQPGSSENRPDHAAIDP